MLKTYKKTDPYLNSFFSFRNKLARTIWNLIYLLLFRPSLRPMHHWRAFLLKCFGAKIGKNCHIYPGAKIWAPWNLYCEDQATIADEAIIYNPSPIYLASHAIISQQAYLCGATHNYNDPSFPLISAPIRIGAYAWVCARATVLMGVEIEEGAVLGLGSVTSKNLDAWSVYAGLPARKIKARRIIKHFG